MFNIILKIPESVSMADQKCSYCGCKGNLVKCDHFKIIICNPYDVDEITERQCVCSGHCNYCDNIVCHTCYIKCGTCNEKICKDCCDTYKMKCEHCNIITRTPCNYKLCTTKFNMVGYHIDSEIECDDEDCNNNICIHCSKKCFLCTNVYCLSCYSKYKPCETCKRDICGACYSKCVSCQHILCDECRVNDKNNVELCSICDHLVCEKCSTKCTKCGVICKHHIKNGLCSKCQ